MKEWLWVFKKTSCCIRSSNEIYFRELYTPAGLLAHEPLRIAQMRGEGESWGEIAKSPTLWMGPAFADTMTRMATRGMRPGSTLARALSLGMSRPMLKTISRRFGMPGLALSLGSIRLR